MNIKIGTELKLVPYVNTYAQQPGLEKALPCKVVYINRPHRFFVVEFKFKFGSFRESYKYYERGDLCEPKYEGQYKTWGGAFHNNGLFANW